MVPKMRPFNANGIISALQRFFQPVLAGKKVLMAFDDPGDKYEKIYDGFGILIPSAYYVCNLKDVLFIPNWWGIFEMNHQGAPDFWGRDLKSVEHNLSYWNADYVICYSRADQALEPEWEQSGYRKVSQFSWAEHWDDLSSLGALQEDLPQWWLLEKSDNGSQAKQI